MDRDGRVLIWHELSLLTLTRVLAREMIAFVEELDTQCALSAESIGMKLIKSSAVQVQGKNIIAYAEYLVSRAAAYSTTKVDYVRAGEGRLKKLSVDKGLLRETESVQDQIRALLKCDVSISWDTVYSSLAEA